MFTMTAKHAQKYDNYLLFCVKKVAFFFKCVCDFSKIGLIKSRLRGMLYMNHVIVAMETQFQPSKVMVLIIRFFVMHSLRWCYLLMKYFYTR